MAGERSLEQVDNALPLLKSLLKGSREGGRKAEQEEQTASFLFGTGWSGTSQRRDGRYTA